MRILLVEDDESIVEVVTAILDEQNYVVDVATDGEAGWDLIGSFPYDLVVLDILLPKLDGISFCRRLRNQKKQVLVMLLTAQDTTTDKLIGLDAGADDYVVKPFDVQELAARIRALLRRGNTVTAPVLTCGQLRLDPSSCEVSYAGQLLRFSRKEYLLLELFLRHQQRVFSRSMIVDQIWSFDEDPPNEDTVKSHVKSIRRKLDVVGAGELIETVYGQGYRINPAYIAAAQLSKSEASRGQFPEAQSSQPHPAEPALTLQHSVSKIWQRTKGVSLARIDVLEQAVQALTSGKLDRELQQQALQSAHKLAGSLGTFGFEAGSQIARQLETTLQVQLNTLSTAAQNRAVEQIAALVGGLRNLLQQETPTDLLAALPLASAVPAAPSRLSAAEAAAEAEFPLLLVCDPDPNLTAAIAMQADEYQVRVATTNTLALAEQQCRQERPNVVLIDLPLLRTKQGQNLLTMLQKQPSVPIGILSAADSLRDRVEAVDAGGQLFLKKPATIVTILQAVNHLLRQSQIVRPRLLVVDDDLLIAKVLTSCLEPQGFQVIALEDSSQFWETLNAIEPALLILDVHIPSINGIELCQTVRSDVRWNWLPIIFLTAQTDRQTQQQIFIAGADDLIIKPIELVEISIRISNRLRRTQLQEATARFRI
jgi:DNA-binding response OmpR family regulator/HPt (histidine-containing phosphotransfer) domain-containing protein